MKSDFEILGPYLECLKHRPRYDRTARVLDDTMSPALQKDDNVGINHQQPEEGDPVAFHYPNDARLRFGYFYDDHLEGPDGSTIVTTDQVEIVGVAVSMIGRKLCPSSAQTSSDLDGQG